MNRKVFVPTKEKTWAHSTSICFSLCIIRESQSQCFSTQLSMELFPSSASSSDLFDTLRNGSGMGVDQEDSLFISSSSCYLSRDIDNMDRKTERGEWRLFAQSLSCTIPFGTKLNLSKWLARSMPRTYLAERGRCQKGMNEVFLPFTHTHWMG